MPEDNFYRQLGKALDLGYHYSVTAPYYGREGQQSIDPIVFLKILLMGYLNNINSDREQIRFCALPHYHQQNPAAVRGADLPAAL